MKKNVIRILAVLLVMALAFTACGGGEEEESVCCKGYVCRFAESYLQLLIFPFLILKIIC